MKNLSTLIIGLLLVVLNLNAQPTQWFCSTAQSITPGTHSVTGPIIGGQLLPSPDCTENFGSASGSRWFVYVPAVDGLATVSSSLGTNELSDDTRLNIFKGTCSNLICLAGDDDIDLGLLNYLSEASFPIVSGSSYYIVWDNSGNPPSFDFSLTETALDCSAVSLPINEDFDDFNSFTACLRTESADANLATFEINTDTDYVENGSNSTIAKDDWLFSTPINLITGHEYTITFKYNGADGNGDFANESLEVLFKDGASSIANTLTSLFTDPAIPSNGSLEQAESMATNQSIGYTSTATGTYYLAFNGTSPANTGSLLLFEYSITNNTLGVNDFNLEGLTKAYNKQTDVLTLSFNSMTFDNLEIYNILGQEVYNKSLSKQVESINLSGLFDGIYIVRVSAAGKTYTTKLLKQ